MFILQKKHILEKHVSFQQYISCLFLIQENIRIFLVNNSFGSQKEFLLKTVYFREPGKWCVI